MLSDDHAPEFDGRFSDGRTAASHMVRVRLDAATLTVQRADGAAPLVWPLTALETAEPITSSAIDVLVHEPGRGGATLFVAEGAFARALAVRAPHLKASAQRWRIARPWVWLTAGVAAIAAIATFSDFSPSRGIASMLPDKSRVALGRQVIKSMSGGHPVCDGTEGMAALASLARKLSAATGTNKTFEVVVVDWSTINAFAAPGEEIVIMRGLLDKAQSADEVAGVLAHEMGHGIELHPEAGIIRMVGLTAITEFMLGGSGGTIANLGLLLTQLGYTRQSEREADRHALAILKKAQIGNRGFSDFFRRMAKIHGEGTDAKAKKGDSTIDMFRTHPSTADRLAVIEAQPGYPAVPALDAAEWKALKGICGVKPSASGPDAKPPPVDAKPPKTPLPQLPGKKKAPADNQRDI